MKTKIKEALKQEYKNLGLSEEAFDGVAAFGETIVKEESEIANFVKGAESLLKGYQSSSDRLRTENAELKRRLEALEKNQPEPEPAPDPEPKPKPDPNPTPNPTDIASIVAEAVKSAVQPLQDKLAAIEGAEAQKTSYNNAHTKFHSNDYVKEYKQQAEDAWERAVEIYEEGGKKLNEDELYEKAIGYFNKYVSRMGVDTSKPFESHGGHDITPNFAKMKERLQASGVMPTSNE